jgi:thiol:disulfide interchange protein
MNCGSGRPPGWLRERIEVKLGRLGLAVLFLVGGAWVAMGQRLDPVKWSLTTEPSTVPPGSRVLARLTARMDPGWHLYSLSTPKGPIPTTVKLLDNAAVESCQIHQPQPAVNFDPNFQLETETFDKEVIFLLDVTLKKGASPGPLELAAQARYQACDAKQCLLPVRRTAVTKITIDPAASSPSIMIPAGYSLFDPSKPSSEVSAVPPARAAAGGGAVQGLGMFMLIAFGFGIAAIFTPCVFPMIPITVSFFLNKQAGSRRQSVFEAAVFCLGIIVLFSSLGLITTAILGPFGTVQLGSNPWVNGFIALVFLVFGLSLLGAFEITIPSSVLTKLDSASRGGGVLGTLIMGLTFSLTAFACVGPFIGTLLAGSVQGGGVKPLVGMTSFATGLAAPFFLLALFPSYLQRLPKSGGWMARVKVVLGFVIVAAMLKYLSNIDAVMQWNILTRDRFLAVWIVLFALAGLYLLGFLRMEGINANEKVGVGRLLTGAAFLIFSISLIPGMFGARLGELDAYIPQPSTTGMAAGPASTRQIVWMKNQYKEALAKARAEDKLIFVSFTGYACTNCHWMKANMFSRPEITEALNDYVLVELYTDGADPASNLNQRVLDEKFSTSAIPYYAILDADERVIASFPGLTRDAKEFLAFLKSPQESKTASTLGPGS